MIKLGAQSSPPKAFRHSIRRLNSLALRFTPCTSPGAPIGAKEFHFQCKYRAGTADTGSIHGYQTHRYPSMTLTLDSGLLTLGGSPGYSPVTSPSTARETTSGSVPVTTAQSSTPSVEELQQLLGQQYQALDNLFMSLGDSQPATRPGLFAAPTSGSGIAPIDPMGDAIDFLLGSFGSMGGTGDMFNLALSANGGGLELARMGLTDAGTAEEAYLQVFQITQMMESMRQSNLNTLLQIGGGSSTTGLDLLI